MKIEKDTQKQRSTEAFTLIEMVLVLAIIALLVGAGVYHLKGVMGSGQGTRVDMDVQALTAALRLYQIDATFLPSTEQGLAALVSEPTTNPRPRSWKRQLDKDLIDPWGNNYQYKFPGAKNPDGFDIWSLGADGVDGTADDIGNFD